MSEFHFLELAFKTNLIYLDYLSKYSSEKEGTQ
jgi:hypothetical protein